MLKKKKKAEPQPFSAAFEPSRQINIFTHMTDRFLFFHQVM